jgi:hypothetical protein
MTKNKEYENFERAATELLKVPHDEIKAKLEAEKKAKKAKRKKPRFGPSE